MSSSAFSSVSSFTASSRASTPSSPKDYAVAFATLQSTYGLGARHRGSESLRRRAPQRPLNRSRLRRIRPTPPVARRATNPHLALCLRCSDLAALSLRRAPTSSTTYPSQCCFQGTKYSPSPAVGDRTRPSQSTALHFGTEGNRESRMKPLHSRLPSCNPHLIRLSFAVCSDH
ncbi:hypothetical protein DFH08DRAFT_839724 [Mycena albidolilacea]|uniref:Uncharacterized protein n=1 Tax=Mycena albidolilacea TaxID=1033008 RepID=A0AAD7AQ56_9AGAR|nr:hypothetical protein DFH08DRAFT_839724 [Mycena albidolilacea]